MTASHARSKRSDKRTRRVLVERALASQSASTSGIRRVSLRASPYASTHPLEIVRVELDSGARLELLLKDLTSARVLESARGVKPERLVDPHREIHVYEHVLAGTALGTPALYASVAATSRYWLLIEHVDGSPLWQVGDFDTWKAAAHWLAAMHESMRDVAAEPGGLLLRYDENELRRWLRLAMRSAGSAGATVRHVAARYDTVVELLTAGPHSLVHGEFYASNVLVGEHGRRICPVDWEMAGTGPGALDVAALAAGWDEAHRSELVSAYHNACTRPTAAPVLERTVEAARIQNALRWLGWSPRWTPPAAHRTDWAREATDAAERLGL